MCKSICIYIYTVQEEEGGGRGGRRGGETGRSQDRYRVSV